MLNENRFLGTFRGHNTRTIISTRVELGKREIVWKHDARRAECFHTISSFPNFHEC